LQGVVSALDSAVLRWSIAGSVQDVWDVYLFKASS